ncbi:SDR family oxidoreductase [Halogeometricum sp. S1BR25-6]|uniref:SDR family oxidoreductase n=1 Tax=Halogeometricum salsisoli TaxID=2950536 RepID=A0ABU2GFW4_9EURY|nr:SDR family oxidoreductase [Halogeometricum sp. S1BR25-6]MDS0299669.1 SDR family oxidoreductase [Halogeometricum sp. S1BR25-6]
MTFSSGRVLVAGATGGTGRRVLETLRSLDADVTVRALTRSAEAESTLRKRGADEVVVGDALSSEDAARAVEGCDAVVCALASSLGLGSLTGDHADGRGVENLVDAARDAGVARFVLVSSIGVGDSTSGMTFGLRLLLRGLGVLSAKARAETHLRESGLAYTILRPGGLTNADATGDVVVGEGGDTVSGSVPRADVAGLCVASLFTPAAENRTFEVVARRGLRGNPEGVVEVDWRMDSASGDSASTASAAERRSASGSVPDDAVEESESAD